MAKKSASNPPSVGRGAGAHTESKAPPPTVNDKQSGTSATSESLNAQIALLNLAREDSRSYRTLLLASVTIFFAVPIANISLEHPEFLRKAVWEEFWGGLIYVILCLIVLPWLAGCAFLVFSLKSSHTDSWLSERRFRQTADALQKSVLDTAQKAIAGAINEERKIGTDLHKRVRNLNIGIALFGLSLLSEFLAFLYWAVWLNEIT